MGRDDRFITDARMLMATIERDPAKLRAYYGDIERLIARCMDELYLLALKKGCRKRRAALADIEYRARLVLKWYRERCAHRICRGSSWQRRWLRRR